MPSAAPSMYAAHALRDATSVLVHSLLRSPPVNAAADSGTASALAKIKARSMVFLSRGRLSGGLSPRPNGAPGRRAKVVILHCFAKLKRARRRYLQALFTALPGGGRCTGTFALRRWHA